MATTESIDPQTQAETQAASQRWLHSLNQQVRVWQRRAWLAGGLAALTHLGWLASLAWWISQVIVAQHLPGPLALTGMLALLGIRALALLGQEHWAHQASAQGRHWARQQGIQRWEQAGPMFMQQHTAARATSQWVEQVEALDGYLARYQPQLRLAILLPLIILGVVFWLDWVAGIILLLSAPLIPLFMVIVGMGAEKVHQRHFLSLSRLAGQFLDRVRHLLTLQLYGRTESTARRLQQVADHYRHLTMKTLRIAFLSSAVLEFFAAVAVAMLAIYIGFGLLGYIHWGPSSELTLFSGLLILMLAPEFFQPMRTLAQHYHDRSAALGAALEWVTAMPDTPTSPTPAPTAPKRHSETELGLDGVSISFPHRGPLLTDFHAQASRGQCIVISGPSGSGKTTLLSLLAGFHAPDRGHIHIFGQPPGAQPCGWLGQQPFFIQGTWRENLALFAPQASPQQMQQALDAVGLGARLLQAPQGLDTPLGETGQGLSGGQLQRLALARVSLTDWPLVLLDEPTAALDPKSAALVIRQLRRWAKQGRLVICASHDPSVQAAADACWQLGE